MTVLELIKELSQYPGGWEVVDDLGYEVRRVEMDSEPRTVRIWFED